MKKVLVVLLCLGLAGCATFSNKMNAINIGMTKDEVIKNLGQPVSTSSEGGTEFLNYSFTEDSAQYWYGLTTPYYVCIREGKVISFGRKGDFGTTAQPKQVIEIKQDLKTEEKVKVQSSNEDDLEGKLKTLNKLLADGLITKDEFEVRKK